MCDEAYTGDKLASIVIALDCEYLNSVGAHT